MFALRGQASLGEDLEGIAPGLLVFQVGYSPLKFGEGVQPGEKPRPNEWFHLRMSGIPHKTTI